MSIPSAMPSDRTEPLNDVSISLDADERDALEDAVAITLGRWLVTNQGREPWFDALVRVGRKIGMNL